MQVKKEATKKRILDAAMTEFMAHGYEKASMRQIATRAGVTKGGIYTYFQSKDDLFCNLAKPGFDVLMAGMDVDYGNLYEGVAYETVYNYEQSYKDMQAFVEFVMSQRDLIFLLFFRSSGSSLEGYKEQLGQIYERNSRKFYDIIGRNNPHLNTQVSELFLHSCANLFLGFMEELLIHNPKAGEYDQFIREMSAFVYFGVYEVIRQVKPCK